MFYFNLKLHLIQFVLQFLLYFIILIKCELQVTGRCGKPGLPPQASLWLITPERSRFDNKEKVLISCKKDEFPVHRQERECRNGKWFGNVARCGK